MRMLELFEEVSYTPVVSSWIDEVGSDGANIYLRLLDGKEYVFYNFPEDAVDDMIAAPSQGQWYHTYIKGQFDYNRIT